MCVRRFTVDSRTLFPYNIMCDRQSEAKKHERQGENLRTAGSIGGRHDYRSAGDGSRTAPQRFTEVCQERRDVSLRVWPVCVERRMGG